MIAPLANRSRSFRGGWEYRWPACNKAVIRLQLQIPHLGSDVSWQVTVSLGIASTIPHPSSTLNELLAAADAALYEAKMQGRDRYCICEFKLNPN
ncbi:MAG: diguanylate cyclase [Leptolyngbyaceae cyanobacterium bins.349]|nr:diguanylate cyclase [Leptolyngbyaceae cyanobacterium bins.349]